MPEEPTIDDILQDANLPATRQNVALVRYEIDAIRSSLADLRKEMLDQMQQMRDEILRHFDVVVENIEDAMSGANADEISLLKNGLEVHEERIGALEGRAGVR